LNRKVFESKEELVRALQECGINAVYKNAKDHKQGIIIKKDRWTDADVVVISNHPSQFREEKDSYIRYGEPDNVVVIDKEGTTIDVIDDRPQATKEEEKAGTVRIDH
jgi:hypothetical protein